MKFGTASIRESLCHGPGGWNYHTWFEWQEQEKNTRSAPNTALAWCLRRNQNIPDGFQSRIPSS